MALFRDASANPNLQTPALPERRKRPLQEMVRKARKPFVLFIDEARDIDGHTLNGLKPLMEFILAGGAKLSVVLVGHHHQQNDLRHATMEEIGNYTSKFDFVALGTSAGSSCSGCLRHVSRTASTRFEVDLDRRIDFKRKAG